MVDELNNKNGSNLDEAFIEKSEKAYQEITSILRKYELMLDWDEGEGILFRDYKLTKYIRLSSSFTNYDIWK